MKKKNAYFTVEAALIIPITLIVVLTIVYLLLYQYDRCILEQDAGGLALWGSTVIEQNENAMQQLITDKLAETDRDIYIDWQWTEHSAFLNGNKFSVKDGGVLRVPFKTWKSENIWNAKTVFSYDRLDEVGFIRLCNRIVEECNDFNNENSK